MFTKPLRSILGGAVGLALAFCVAALPAFAGVEQATLTAADGVKLKITYTSPEDVASPSPAVLLLHMCNSDRSAWSGLSAALAARGIHSVALDYRGYGESGGERLQGAAQQQIITAHWPGDVDAAWNYLRSQPGVDTARMAAAGGSCGVNQAVQVARRHPGDVKALVLLAGSANAEGQEYLSAASWLPILGVASHDDGRAVEVLRWTIGFSGHAENRVLEYEKGGHGTELFAVHADLEPAIADWLVERLVRKVAVPVAAGEPGPSAKIWTRLRTDGSVAALREGLARAKETGVDPGLPPEFAVNNTGYELMGEGKTEQAIELLAFNVEANPGSANALDSLGDAYLAAGEPAKAAELAQRTIEAIPNDPNLTEDFAKVLREAAEAKLPAAAEASKSE